MVICLKFCLFCWRKRNIYVGRTFLGESLMRWTSRTSLHKHPPQNNASMSKRATWDSCKNKRRNSSLAPKKRSRAVCILLLFKILPRPAGRPWLQTTLSFKKLSRKSSSVVLYLHFPFFLFLWAEFCSGGTCYVYVRSSSFETLLTFPADCGHLSRRQVTTTFPNPHTTSPQKEQCEQDVSRAAAAATLRLCPHRMRSGVVLSVGLQGFFLHCSEPITKSQ